MIRLCVLSNATSGNNRKGLERLTARLAAYPQLALEQQCNDTVSPRPLHTPHRYPTVSW